MTYHDWSEKDFDWVGLDKAITIIQETCYRYGRLGGQAKEKYGQVRFYTHFGYLNLHNLIYPGYAYNRFPNWLWKLDCKYIGPILRFFFERAFQWWQAKWYNIAYQRALKAYPHLAKEILVAVDYPKLIEGYYDIFLHNDAQNTDTEDNE